MSYSPTDEIYLQGVAVSEGIAIGQPFFLKPIEEDIPDFEITLGEVDAEVARYRKALFSSKEDLNRLRQDLAIEATEGTEEALSTIDTHIQMLDDPMITTDMEGKIRQMLRNTESVFRSVMCDYENRFSERTDSFFHERLVDVKDVSTRILGHLRKKQDAQLTGIPAGSIVFASEIPPSCSAAAHSAQIGAFVTDSGGGNSHAALIARAKGIPYVAAIEGHIIEKLQIDHVIVDGYQGIVIANPTKATLEEYRNRQKQLATRYQYLVQQDHLSSETIDKCKIKLFVNVGNPHDLDAYSYRHDGVGLFRTEYLFLQTKEFFPSEQYQMNAYQKLIERMEQRPVVIRCFDLGGDKSPSLFFSRKSEPNPALGNRGIRFLLRNPHLFQLQLRAIFQAANEGNVRILLPLISDINELRSAKKIIEEVKEELRRENCKVAELPLGAMIEVPSAVMICEKIAEEVDFFSIGTNDLVQYTLGVDRSNPAMSELFYPAHPSVIRMIKMILTKAKQKKMPVSICGEIASNILFTPLLMGLGLHEFSVAPRYLPHVKQVIRQWTLKEAEELAEKALSLTDPHEISALLTESQKK